MPSAMFCSSGQSISAIDIDDHACNDHTQKWELPSIFAYPNMLADFHSTFPISGTLSLDLHHQFDTLGSSCKVPLIEKFVQSAQPFQMVGLAKEGM